MDYKYPHWYHCNEEPDCCELPEPDMCCCDDPMPPNKVRAFPTATFRDRLLCMLGDEILFSVDARFCKRESFCGTLCYVGCDFIIVNVCLRHKPVSLHIPICALRFFAPYKGKKGIY